MLLASSGRCKEHLLGGVQIVSDVAARGLDIQGCDAVFNLELPSDAAAYAHRAGRTGRMGGCVRV